MSGLRQRRFGFRGCRTLDQRGSGSLLAAGVVLVLMILTGVGVTVSVLALGQRDVANAADLVALSAAAARSGGNDPCAAAARIATAEDVDLTSCTAGGDQVDFVVAVGVQRRLHLSWGMSITLKAQAEAGRLGAIR